MEASVIIPTYNRADKLRSCLAALSNQTQPACDFEIIVVVDGSTDETVQMLADLKTPFALRVISQPNSGQPVALNRGVAESRGRISIFLDDDIIVTTRFVAEHLRLHHMRDQVVGIGQLTLTLPAGADSFARGFAQSWCDHYAELNRGKRQPDWDDCYGGNMSVARAAFMAVGGNVTDLRRGYDVELAYRLKQYGCSFEYLPEALGNQHESKGFRELSADSEFAGEASVELARRHPAIEARLFGHLKENRRSWILLWRLLSISNLSTQGMERLERLTVRSAGAFQWFAFFYHYYFWKGVRRAMSHMIKTSMVSSQTIPWNETIYHPHSFADPDGRVFLWEGQLYRGIFPAAAPFFRRLAENGTISNLVEQGFLVNTELTPFTSNEFSLVFRHRFVPFASYPQEWCPLMLKDAALAIVDLATELAHADLILKDGHPWNVLFEACKPVYIDLGSIAPENGYSIWSAYPDFCRYCLYPLILMSQGYDLMGRLLMCEDRGVRESELFRLAPRLAFRAYIRWPVNLVRSYAEKHLTSVTNRFLKKQSIAITSGFRRQARNQKNLLSFLKQVRRLVESIPVSTLDFQKGVQENPVDSAQEYSDARALYGEVIHRILTELHPHSILDINSGEGSLAKQAANLGVPVVCFETDHRKVSRLYREAKTKGLPILPLVMDFTKPTPARGLDSHWAIAATERFQCDLVLAVDFLNQPMPRRLGFDKIINALGQFSKRWLVLEIPPDLGSDSFPMKDNQPRGFSIDGCIRLLKMQFRIVTKMDSPVKGSTLLVCEKY